MPKAKRDRRIRRWAKERSAITYIEEINNNQPAIYLSQNYDQLFSVNQIIHFFDKLTTQKNSSLTEELTPVPKLKDFSAAFGSLDSGFRLLITGY